MAMIAVTSAGSSPGATTVATALTMVWASQAHEAGDVPLLVEANPAGGIIGARFGCAAEPSFMTYVADARRGFAIDVARQNSQKVGTQLDAILAPIDPIVARRVMSDPAAKALSEGLAASPTRSVVDLGRLDSVSPCVHFAVAAQQVLVVTRPRFDEVQTLLFLVRQLRAAGANPGLVVVGETPHQPVEVAESTSLPLVAVLPDDAKTAAAFAGGRFTQRALSRSLLWRTFAGMVAEFDSRQPATIEAPAVAPSADDRAESGISEVST